MVFRLWAYGRGGGSGPPRRPSDAFEAWASGALLAALLLGAPAAGVAAGSSLYERGRAAQANAGERVQAVLLADAPPPITSSEGTGDSGRYAVPVRWTAPDGSAGQGVAPVHAGLRRGDRADVWLDARGRVTAPPRNDAEIWLEASAAGSGAAAGVVLVFVSVRVAVRRAADHRRMDEWEQDWARTEPVWTGRRS
ncbi:hypothetical protein ACIQMR_15760 [Streptomyces sp. NPDC091376]|uniref:Rv1733c family protein n=1 Tax=Streptomyces sp. NPDC091376 TaxID=3365994 RepID=UPI0038300B89